VRAQLQAELAHDLAPAGRRRHPPDRKGRLRRGQHALKVRAGGLADGAQHPAVGGGEGFDSFASGEPFKAGRSAGVYLVLKHDDTFFP